MHLPKRKHNSIIFLCLFLIIVACAEQDKKVGLEAEITLPLQDQEIREGELVFFEGSASGGTPPYAYYWDFGKTMPPIKRKETGQVVFDFEGAYKVLFTVKDSKGDESIDSVRIIVNPKS